MARTPAPLEAKARRPLAARAALPFTIPLDREAPESLPQQIAAYLRAAIRDGRLPPGTPLPSSRALARDLGVSRGVPLDAYAHLLTEGYLEAQHGSGTRVARDLPPGAPTPVRAAPPTWLPPLIPAPVDPPATPGGVHLRLGQPTTRTLDTHAWRAAWTHATRAAPPDDYGDPRGDPALRAALATFIGRARALSAHPDDLILTNGSAQAITLIARALLPPSATVAFEDPGYRLARTALAEAGARILPIAVDDDGLRVDTLPVGPDAPRLVFVTPSHQYPLGVRLALPRRLALLAWARAHDALIIEDDYDGEYRYDAPPLPPLASLDNTGRVLYVGTLSKVLTPAVRTAFIHAAPPLAARLTRARQVTDAGGDAITQAALAHFIAGGHLDRHVRRTARTYAQVRQTLSDALLPLKPHATLRGLDAGLHACLDLAPPLRADRVAAALATRGVHVQTLRGYYAEPSEHQALLLGYGSLTHADAQHAARTLRSVIMALRDEEGAA
ncbi:PLP-dependent aminotransferase family protein [Deinococcus maricopensis]|uniref:Transcriptional regulator, GntR family with aminotransferase domain protein n=1 Tax=Deinococcus maricopensis (strain DSM 21211 / LMG 22137 / NRRL B-23946 / LB-34) TaxID=709986 RepID=E8UAJ8_DEIML|nr:PLP-dependent aminotransferase family protein [Deinococcus maricopensis]ADV68087.1 transcriptional regulator, GntR family with aminotransferase domain protein [Deinococcus maricopensis DSM 21211]